MTVVPLVNWTALRAAAAQAATHAHCPYSNLAVGAAGVTDSGQIATGCNVENASYGLTLCAECGLVSDLYRSGAAKLIAVTITSGTGEFLWPCGRCRQLLFEAGGPDLLVDSGDGPVRLAELLPFPFGRDDLPNASTGTRS